MDRIHCYICNELIGKTYEDTHIALYKQCFYGKNASQAIDMEQNKENTTNEKEFSDVIKQINFSSCQ